MFNLFQEVSNGSEARLFGQTYPYNKNNKSSTQNEIGSKEITDINGLIHYIELLVSGKNQEQPLGNTNFLKMEQINDYSELSNPSNPSYQELTMQTIDIGGENSSEIQYVTLSDIQNYVPEAKNKDGFQNSIATDASPVMSEDPIDQLYFASLCAIGLYILYRIMEKSR